MSEKNPWSDLHEVLNVVVGFELRGEKANERQYRFTGRIPQEFMGMWLEVQQELNRVTDTEKKWTIDISKHYFPINNYTSTRYAWRIILQGEDLKEHIPLLTHTVASTPAPVKRGSGPRRVMSVELRSNPNRNDPSRQRGKGAQNALTSVTGKALKERMGL